MVLRFRDDVFKDKDGLSNFFVVFDFLYVGGSGFLVFFVLLIIFFVIFLGYEYRIEIGIGVGLFLFGGFYKYGFLSVC